MRRCGGRCRSVSDRLVAVLEQHPQRGLMAVRPANYVNWRDRAWCSERSAAQIDTTFVMAARTAISPAGWLGRLLRDLGRRAPSRARVHRQRLPASDRARLFGQRGGVVVLSDAFWRSQFGAGRRRDWPRRDPRWRARHSGRRVAGLIPRPRSQRSLVPVEPVADALAERRFHYLPMIARAAARDLREQAQREMTRPIAHWPPPSPENAEWGVARSRGASCCSAARRCARDAVWRRPARVRHRLHQCQPPAARRAIAPPARAGHTRRAGSTRVRRGAPAL